MRVNRIGEKHITNEGYEVEIISWSGVRKCTIQFKCGLVVRDLQYSGVKDGRIKYPFHPSVYGIGYFGIGKYFQKRKGVYFHTYNTWKNMLERCYSKKSHEKYPTYKNATVCEEWHDFQVFGKWFEENYKSEAMSRWHLDKDILKKGNKIYSPETCCFVPSEINSLFINCKATRGNLPVGVIKHRDVFRVRMNFNGKFIHIGLYKTIEEAFQAYKTAKEEYIKEMADKWKNQITPQVYKAMYNYIIEITD